MNYMSSNINDSKEDKILRKYFTEFDDDTVESLKRYYNIHKSDHGKFLK